MLEFKLKTVNWIDEELILCASGQLLLKNRGQDCELDDGFIWILMDETAVLTNWGLLGEFASVGLLSGFVRCQVSAR